LAGGSQITTLFVDIGGVLLTNGWDHVIRKRAVTHSKLKLSESEERHHLMFAAYEEGKLTLEDYLGRVAFHKSRPFTRAEFRRYMFAQSKPYPQMIELIASLKARYRLKVVVVSNEGRELNAHRIGKYKLGSFVYAFVSSCFVHLRKPDADIFQLALDIAQTPAAKVIYIDNTAMLVQIAEGLGIRSILHTDYKTTRAQLSALGLKDKES